MFASATPQFQGSFLFDLSQTSPEKAKKFADRAMQLMPIDMTLETDSISFYRNVGAANVAESTMTAVDITRRNYPKPFEPETAQVVFVNHNSPETSQAFEMLGKHLDVPYITNEQETETAKPVLLSLLFDTDFRQQLRQLASTLAKAELPAPKLMTSIHTRLNAIIGQLKRLDPDVSFENRKHWLTQMALMMNRVLFDKIDATHHHTSTCLAVQDPEGWDSLVNHRRPAKHVLH